MKTLLRLLLIFVPIIVQGQRVYVYAGLDAGIVRGNLNSNFHCMLKVCNFTVEPTVRLYTLSEHEMPFMTGGRLGYEYGELLSITPFAGLYYGYHGPEASDKFKYNGKEWEYGIRLKWSPQSTDAAGFYLDISRLKRLSHLQGITPVASVVVGMTLFEPNNKK